MRPFEKRSVTPQVVSGDLSPISSRKVEMLRSGKEIFAKMLHLIDTAKYSIDMQYYSFEADETGRKVLDACKRAKERNPNLKIRLLVDNSIEYLHNGERIFKSEDARQRRDATNELLMQLRDDGVLDDVKVTNKFSLEDKKLNLLHLYSNVLHRDHKKLFLVDARDTDEHPDAVPKAVVGSANVNKYHEKDWKDAARYFEGGDIVRVLAEDFEYTDHHAEKWKRIYEVKSPSEYFQKYGLWQIASHPLQSLSDLRGAVVRNAERKGKRVVTTPDAQGRKERDEVVATDSFFPSWFFGLGRRAATTESFGLLKQAKAGETVIVAGPYPGFFSLSRRLIRASRKGVDVNLVIPKINNHALYNHQKIDEVPLPDNIPLRLQQFIRRVAHANLYRWERKLAKNGVHVYKYTGEKEGLDGMLHFKGMQLLRNDEEQTTRSINGSANYTKGVVSGFNREIIVATEGTVDTDPMVPFMQELMADSEYIPPTRNYRRRSNAA